MNLHLIGRTPGVHLDENGILQARRAAIQLSREDIRIVYTSPLARAREIAAIIAQRRIPIEVAASFNEQDFGSWTRLTFAFLDSDPLWNEFNRSRSRVAAPNGEAALTAQQRALAGLDQVARDHQGSTVAIVTHADIIRSILCHCDGFPLDELLRYEVGFCSITTLEYDARWRVLQSGRPLPMMSRP